MSVRLYKYRRDARLAQRDAVEAGLRHWLTTPSKADLRAMFAEAAANTARAASVTDGPVHQDNEILHDHKTGAA